LLHQVIKNDILAGEMLFPTHFFGQKNPSFSDHFKSRSENTKHTFGNN